MAHGQNGYSFAIEVVKRDIATISKVDEPFSKFGFHTIDRTADAWLTHEHLHTDADRSHSPARGVRILRREKAIQALYIIQRLRCPCHS